MMLIYDVPQKVVDESLNRVVSWIWNDISELEAKVNIMTVLLGAILFVNIVTMLIIAFKKR